MPVEALVVLILAIAGFVAMGVWALVWGRDLRFPKGMRRTTLKRGNVTVHVLTPPSYVGAGELAKSTVRAIWVSCMAWGEYRKNEHKEFAVHYAPDAQFNETDWLRHVAAYLSSVPRPLGAGIPCPVVRIGLADEMIRTGEPVIHEMMHALLGEYSSLGANRDHKTDGVWIEASGASSIQFAARELYGRLTIGDAGKA